MNQRQTDAQGASDNPCIFCKIVKGEAPSKKVYEDKDTIAFLDINPATSGHTLIIPKKHFATIHDIDGTHLEKIMNVAKTMADRAKNRLKADGVNVLQSNGRHAGQLVDHIHVHVIPRYENDNITIRFPRAQLSEEEMKKVQDKLKEEDKEKYDAGTHWI